MKLVQTLASLRHWLDRYLILFDVGTWKKIKILLVSSCPFMFSIDCFGLLAVHPSFLHTFLGMPPSQIHGTSPPGNSFGRRKVSHFSGRKLGMGQILFFWPKHPKPEMGWWPVILGMCSHPLSWSSPFFRGYHSSWPSTGPIPRFLPAVFVQAKALQDGRKQSCWWGCW